MKPISQMLLRLRKNFAARRGKKGSSLALVMMIGAALVIWVMCIMPLMSTTGTAAYNTQGSYDDYLLSRSVIEFCKSELEKIVEEKLPYTFAVKGDLDEKFTVVPKYNTTGLTVRPEYAAMVKSNDPLDDRKDEPTSDDVRAICAVEPNVADPNIYDIIITTYENCEKQLTYTATFTPRGSLMIHPEAYKQNQALPLSDFVVVDGKMGSNRVWNSTITMGNADSLGFTESLLRWIAPTSSEWHPGYANTGEYPAVFKTTANAASDSNVSISDPVTLGDLASDEAWFTPQAGSTGTAGNIWYNTNDGTIRIYMYTTENVDITADCTIYLNGRVTYDREIPDFGIYTVSVDYKGTDYSTEENLDKYDDSKINVLPINGLRLTGNIDKVKNNERHTLNENIQVEKIEKVEHKNDRGEVINTTYTVTLTKPESADLLYCISESNGANVTWTTNNVFEGLSNAPGTAYFFFACRPASYENGVFYADSPVKSAGMIFVPRFVDRLTSGTQYAIIGQANGTDYALKSGVTVDALSYNNGFLVRSTDMSAYAWTAAVDNNYWNFRNSSDSYLRINATPDPQYTVENINNHGGYWWGGGHSCKRYSCTSCDWTFSVTTANNSFSFDVTRNGNDFTLHYEASHTENYKEYDCSRNNNKQAKFKEDVYLNLNGSVSVSYDQTTVRFMQLPPSAPTNIPSPSASFTIGNTVTYGTNVVNHVSGSLNGAELVTLYANNREVTGGLNAGIYHMVAKVKKGDLETWANLGTLTVNKADLDASELTVTAVRNADDELRVDVSATGWHNNGGIRYFGYKKTAETDYHWYTTDDQTYMFRLPYGSYNFAVRETGGMNHNGAEASFDGSITLEAQFVSADKININDFIYTFDKTTKEVVWYELPDEIIPLRVTLVYGYYWEGWTWRGYKESLHWSTEYHGDKKSYQVQGTSYTTEDHEHLYYGVIISGTDYYPPSGPGDTVDDNYVFRISQPVGINTINGHTSSMMRGSSLYFMGSSGSINTHGTDIFLTTDLLVLNSDIIGGGKVEVAPYNSMAHHPGDILLFVSNPAGIVRGGNVIFQGRNFYRIPNGTDLCSLNATTTATWRVGDINNVAEKRDIDYLFRNKVFPEINLDIAYADRAQLSRIINSETIGWSDEGIISGSSTSTNPGYAITAYLTGMNGDVSYKANRVLIAANVGGAKTLNVTDDLSITTRYLSVEADQVVGSGEATFMLYNLAQDQGFVQMISNALGLTNYSSKSLQMDYERPTLIISSSGGTISMNTQICRYENGTNLLSSAASKLDLMADYTTSEIEYLFENGILSSFVGSTVKTVDRYIALRATEGEGNTIDISSLITGSKLDIYANYVYVDSSVHEINMSSWLGGSDIRISSQESGYTTQEYLGIFKGHTAETYTGTILYFSGSVRINLGNNNSKTISPGFYWIAATDDGTSLTALADNPSGYAIDPEELRAYSVYINPDGSLSNSYVDTGLLDNTNAGAGGFSGGAMG